MDLNVTQTCSNIFNNVSCPTYKVDDHADVPVLKAGAKTFYLVGLVLMWLWTVLIIFLNVAVIITISCYKKTSRLYFYLLNLAIADLASGLFDAFPNAMERSFGLKILLQIWLAGDIACKLQRTLANMCTMTSNYLLAAMSIDRAYAICKPMSTLRKGKILQRAVVVSCWVFSFICSTPCLKYHVIKSWKEDLEFLEGERCTLIYNGDVVIAYRFRFYLMFAFVFCIPLVIISGSYVLLIVSMWKRALHQTPSEKKREQTEQDRMTMSRVFNKGVPKSKVKSIKLTLGIVLSFLICWMAYFLANFLSFFADIHHPVLAMMTTFFYLNSIANPILFFIYHKKTVRSPSSLSFSSSKNSRRKGIQNTDGTDSIRNHQNAKFAILEG